MKKILLVTRPIAPPWDEASKNFAYFMAKNLQGNELHLMTKDFVFDLPVTVQQHPVYTTAEIAEFNLSQKIRSLFFQFQVRGHFDINHYFFTPTKLNSFLIKHFLVTGQTKTIQTIATLREDLWSDQDIRQLLFGDLVITYSDYAKEKLQALGFANTERIYPGIDLTKYAYGAKDQEALDFFGLTKKHFVISYPGEYTRLGATDSLVAALPKLFQKIPHARFMFACRVKNEKDARKKIEIIETLKKQKILDKVIFTDTFADMPKLYNLADVVAFPVHDMRGKFDVPLAVIEAMACEKPVIISDLPILQEFAKKENSIIIKTGDTQEFIEACAKLEADPDKCLALGKNARAYVAANFDITQVAQKYQTVYEKI